MATPGMPPPPPPGPGGLPPPPPAPAPAGAPPPPPAAGGPPPPPGAAPGGPPPPPPAGGVPPPDASKLTVRSGANGTNGAAAPKKARPTKSAASRAISSNITTLRGHKLSKNKDGAGADVQKIAQADAEYPVAEIYNVGVYLYNESTSSWAATDEGVFSRAFVTYNPHSFRYRMLGVKQVENGSVGLNTPVLPDLKVFRKGRFIQFRDKSNIYLLAFTSKDDAFVFEGIINEVKREQVELAGKRDKKATCICCGVEKPLPNCKKAVKDAGGTWMVGDDPVLIPIKKDDASDICDSCWFANLNAAGRI